MDRPMDKLPEGALERRIRDAQRLAAEFKAPQVTSGKSGQLGYVVESGKTWDLSGSTSLYSIIIAVTYTGDGSQDWPLAVPLSDIRIGGTAESNKLKFNVATGLFMSGPASYATVDILDLKLLEDPHRLRWLTQLYLSSPTSYYVKARVQASSPGDVSVELATWV